MNKYKYLLFDLDDTLIDNRKSVRHAFKVILNYLNIAYDEDLLNEWINFDGNYWGEWESGKMIIPEDIKTVEETLTYLRSGIFQKFFKDQGLSFNEAVAINKEYNLQKGEVVVPIDGAQETLRYLNDKYKIAVVTNGPHEAAIKKLEKSGVTHYVSYLISSELVGFSKPMKEFFNYVDERINEYDRDRQLLIGDSLHTDILGGNLNGIDTCLYAPKKVEIPDDIKPTMIVKKMGDLRCIL